MSHVLILHGPNMFLKGVEDIDDALRERASELGVELHIHRANGESGLIDGIEQHLRNLGGVIVNLGPHAGSAVALAETLRLIGCPSIALGVEADGVPVAQGLAQNDNASDKAAYLRALESISVKIPPAESSSELQPQAELGIRKTIGRRLQATALPGPVPTKSIGRKEGLAAAATDGLGRMEVSEQIRAKLSGRITTQALSAWARERWAKLQGGAPCEDGQRETLDSVLLALSSPVGITDDALVAALTRLSGLNR